MLPWTKPLARRSTTDVDFLLYTSAFYHKKNSESNQ